MWIRSVQSAFNSQSTIQLQSNLSTHMRLESWTHSHPEPHNGRLSDTCETRHTGSRGSTNGALGGRQRGRALEAGLSVGVEVAGTENGLVACVMWGKTLWAGGGRRGSTNACLSHTGVVQKRGGAPRHVCPWSACVIEWVGSESNHHQRNRTGMLATGVLLGERHVMSGGVIHVSLHCDG
jgi:hypothetical protein